MLRKSVFLLVAVLLAACGTVPPPAYELPTLTFAAQERADAFATTTAVALAALQPAHSQVAQAATPAAEVDTDKDGLSDAREAELGSNPNNPDSDGDGLTDAEEVNTYGTNPTLADTDGDGLRDGDEVKKSGTNPTLADTDGDGVNDYDDANPLATPLPVTPTVAEPTAAPTVAATIDPSLAENDPLSIFIANADAAAAAALVKNPYLAEDGSEWACSTCHNYAEPVAGLGPSMVGVGTRAYSRVPGMGPYTYLYNSIRDPQSYIVAEFANAAQQMPHFRKDSLTEDMVYNIIAYLMTLQ